MVMRRCDADEHHYDDLFEVSCPHCHAQNTSTKLGNKRPLTLDDIGDTVALRALPGSQDRASPEMPVTAVYGHRKALAPVVGWLVISSCPRDRFGRDHAGSDRRLISGTNQIGRDASMAVQLDFGDNDIAQENHCAVTYDPLSRLFYLQAGDGQYLTYTSIQSSEGESELQWDVLLQPKELTAMELFKIGETVLRFVPYNIAVN